MGDDACYLRGSLAELLIKNPASKNVRQATVHRVHRVLFIGSRPYECTKIIGDGSFVPHPTGKFAAVSREGDGKV